jgi:hypothetical protein
MGPLPQLRLQQCASLHVQSQAVWLSLQKLLQSLLVEPHDSLTIDHSDRCGGKPHAHQFIEGLLIPAHVLLDKSDAHLVKELLHTAAEESAWLRVDDH